MKKRVAVLFGGQSTEHEVSRASAVSVLKNIDPLKYDVCPIGITKDGKWLEYSGNYEMIENGEWEKQEAELKQDGQNKLFHREVDVVFPVLHGLYGEDGTIQGVCKLVQIPCVAPGVLSSAICMDKVYTKYLLERFQVKQANYIVIQNHEFEEDNMELLGQVEQIEQTLGYPVFIKPANSGSSVGISKAHDHQELIIGIKNALTYDRKVLVEQAINAREIEVSVLGNENPKASVPGEIIPAKEFYDYEAKYQSESSKLLIPASLDENKLLEIQALAIKVYRTLDCAGMARVDFLVDQETDEVFLNEVNTIPGFTKISMYPKLWQATGKPYADLIDELINFAIERNNN